MQNIQLQSIETNGITLQVAVAGKGPLCILVHGWPELWISWRHQIQALVQAGYRVAAPDVRGYGGSDRPPQVEAYEMPTIVADIVGLMDALGEEQAILIGHDWGAPIVYYASLLHPDRVRAVVGMSVPHMGQGPMPPTELFASLYEDRFFYMLYFQQPEVPEAEFEADIPDALRKIFYYACGEVSQEVRRSVRKRTSNSGYLEGMSYPEPFPAFLSPEELDEYAQAFAESGFRGSLNRYRCLDRDYEQLSYLNDTKISQPALFIAGEHDSVLRYVPGMDMLELMSENFERLQDKIIIPGAGHWVQQEKPAEVNQALLEFLEANGL